MDFVRQIILSIILGASMLFVSFAQAQSSQQVSSMPLPLIRGTTTSLRAPLSSGPIFDQIAATLAPGADQLPFNDKFRLIEQADPFFLIEQAAEFSVLRTYDEALRNNDLGMIIGALAYMTGLASPLYSVEVTAHNRLPSLFPKGDVTEETFTVRYMIHRGYIRLCRTQVLVRRDTQELLDINFDGCEHYIQLQQ
jgi:hypothetical protein